MEYFYLIMDDEGHCVGFTDDLEDAIQMARKYNGYYELTQQRTIFP